MDILDALSRTRRDPPHHHPPRAGRGVHGRRLRPPDRSRRRRDGDARARARRTSSPASPTRTSTARRWSRSPARRRSDKLHKEAHQVVDIVGMFEPVTKWNTRVERVEAIPEIVRKAFRVATLEKPGPDPHRAAREPRRDGRPEPTTTRRPARCPAGPTSRSRPTRRSPTPPGCIAASERPIVLAGNGVLRRGASRRAARVRAAASTSRSRRRSWARARSTTGRTSR